MQYFFWNESKIITHKPGFQTRNDMHWYDIVFQKYAIVKQAVFTYITSSLNTYFKSKQAINVINLFHSNIYKNIILFLILYPWFYTKSCNSAHCLSYPICIFTWVTQTLYIHKKFEDTFAKFYILFLILCYFE